LAPDNSFFFQSATVGRRAEEAEEAKITVNDIVHHRQTAATSSQVLRRDWSRQRHDDL
jgi:hypothetical protein